MLRLTDGEIFWEGGGDLLSAQINWIESAPVDTFFRFPKSRSDEQPCGAVEGEEPVSIAPLQAETAARVRNVPPPLALQDDDVKQRTTSRWR